jgi:hypothetical protein
LDQKIDCIAAFLALVSGGSAYRAGQATVADDEGIPVSVQTLVKRLHETNLLRQSGRQLRRGFADGPGDA